MIINNPKVLDEINQKLDLLIDLQKITNSLLKISGQETLVDLRKQIKNDEIFSKIFEYSNGTRSYGELASDVSYDTEKAEITIKKKITELRGLGVIATVKKGKETVYEKTGVL